MKIWGYSTGATNSEGKVCIELPPPDISKIKEGDEVWIKGIVEIKDRQNWVKLDCIHQPPENIIAHFPNPQEYCECKERYTKMCWGGINMVCTLCGKPLPPKQEKKLPERLTLPVQILSHQEVALKDKINQLIDYLGE